jgi:hypothetical protein
MERRQMRDLREPPNANRIRSRGLGINARAAWVYTAAEMAAWKAWFEGPLATQVARLRFWNAPLPGRGGVLTRVARYMEPPQREYLGQGLWRITAPLYVRGLSVAVQQEAAATAADLPLQTEDDIDLLTEADEVIYLG